LLARPGGLQSPTLCDWRVDMTEYWFRPKQRGIGAGVPLNWKGWALFAAYLGSIIGVPTACQLMLGYPGSALLRTSVVALISVPFLLVAWKKTEGGWRWRSGEEETSDERERA
jgi:hypothetical protein